MNVDVSRAIEVRLDSERTRARPRIRESRARRLLHHVAKRAGELHLAATLHDADFDLQHLAARRRVGEPGRDAHLVVERSIVGIEGSGAQQLLQVVGADGLQLALTRNLSARLRASFLATRAMRRSSSRTPASRV